MRPSRAKRSKAKVTADKPLTEREQRFVDAYIVEPDAGRAARSAGYDCKTDLAFSVVGCRIRNKVNVAGEIARRMQKASEAANLTVIDMLRELRPLCLSNMDDYLQEDTRGRALFRRLSELTREQKAAISELVIEGKGKDQRIKFKLYNKHDALVTLGRYLKMFLDTREAAPDDRTAIFSRTLSAVDRIVADALSAAARGHGARALPNGSLLPVEVLPPQT